MSATQQLFTELFRAKSLDRLVLPSRILAELNKGLVQNLMLYGPPGSGKSTIARILVEGYDVLKLNGSSENGIDVMRNQVVSFASVISLEEGQEKMKVVYIDEADGLTEAAWDAMRATIEQFASSVRFVCTCNKIDKIPSPIRSRFNCIPVYPINKEEEDYVFQGYCNYVGQILTGIRISYEEDVLKEFVRSMFPDMRSILNTIQTLYLQQATELDRNSIIKSFDCSDLFELIINVNDPVENYKFVMTNYASSPDDAMREISKTFVDFLIKTHPEYSSKIPYVIITTAEYMQQLTSSPDRVVVLLACVFKLQTILHS